MALNFDPPEFVAPERSLFLLPDQGLVRQGVQYASIPLRALEAHVHVSRFITTAVPGGVQPVDYTWTYVNKSGGPDGRYKNNPQLPIIEVGEIDFYGPGGFQFHTGFTSVDAVHRFADAFEATKAVIPAV